MKFVTLVSSLLLAFGAQAQISSSMTESSDAAIGISAYGRGSGLADRVTCESKDYKYKTCAVQGRIQRVTLVRKLSDTACVQNRSWGYDRDSIWVDRGCRGVFEVQTQSRRPGRDGRYNPGRPGRGGGYNPGYPGRSGMDITCESKTRRLNSCQVPFRISRVNIKRQLSSTRCVLNQTWGYSGNQIWVDRGCRAVFTAW